MNPVANSIESPATDSTTRLVFAAIACFLVLFPLTIQKPGLPLTLKADEAAYYLMAESLARDRDLVAESQDLRRLFDAYPVRPAMNVILMSDDGWHSTYFGKPYIYSLFAAPWVRAFGPNGMVAFNMLLLLTTVWMGAVYLGRFNAPGISLAFSAGFFLIASSFVYVFWLHPEVFNLASIAGCLFFGLHRFTNYPKAGLWNRVARWAPFLSGAILAFGVYNKPMFAAVGLAALYASWRRFGLKGAGAWLLGAALSMTAICGLAIQLTGHPSAYLGVARTGVNLESEVIPVKPVEIDPAQGIQKKNSWGWLIGLPPVHIKKLVEDIPYFLWGRHTGLFPYMPFAALALILFVIHGRGSPVRWILLASIVIIALYTMLWIWFNWHGGGGFVGNRYFVSVYPAFFFLITKIRPRWATVVGYAVGGLLLGGLLFTPFGVPVREPTLQSHVRYAPFRWFPYELSSIRTRIPGYQGVSQQGLHFIGRQDVFRKFGDWMWTHAGEPVEIFVLSWEPIDEISFFVQSLATPNQVEIKMGGDKQVVHLESEARGQITLKPKHPYKKRWELDFSLREPPKQMWVYRMFVKSARGSFPPATGEHPPTFRVGATLLHIGDTAGLDDDLFYADWRILDAPVALATESESVVRVAVRNASHVTWPYQDTTRLGLSYHWLNSDGSLFRWENDRARFGAPVEPNVTKLITIPIVAPDKPGEYLLAIDIVREMVGWFSQKNPQSVPPPIPVRVVAPTFDLDIGQEGASAESPDQSPPSDLPVDVN